MSFPRPRHLLPALLLTAPLAGAQVTTRLVATGFTRPIWAGAPAGDARIFIATKGGRIRVVEDGVLLPTLFLDINPQVAGGTEQGLLGVAFHPDYASNGYVYVDYTQAPGGATVVSRFTVSTTDRNVLDPTSETVLLTVNQPFANHNAGDLHFGPDGYLYVFLGDGGSANDPGCRAQNLGNLLGKILRIDVDGAAPYAIPPTNPFVGVAGAREEVFHYGLRNPWRNSFDALTGDLFIGDVGQDQREEIDVAPAGSSGLNFGWRIMEGTRCNGSGSCTSPPACGDPALVAPITELTHPSGAGSIIGGVVYRGCLNPGEYGRYFFTDFLDHKIRSLEYDRNTGTISNLQDRTAELAPGGGLAISAIPAFGVDGFGELLICDYQGSAQGEVFKMVPAPPTQSAGTPRNGSGVNRECLVELSRVIPGNLWELRVDGSGHPGALSTVVAAYASPTSGVFLAGNEVLVDASSALLLKVVKPASGAIDAFDVNVPCEPGLIGLTFSVQGGIVGGGLELCNAIDVTVGHY
jgi:glucose/arabinose dehydrogenase